MRGIETIDSELRLVATLRRGARERGGPLPSIDVADALLDERRELGHAPTPPPQWEQGVHPTLQTELPRGRWRLTTFATG
jgi:hypothetical protein